MKPEYQEKLQALKPILPNLSKDIVNTNHIALGDMYDLCDKTGWSYLIAPCPCGSGFIALVNEDAEGNSLTKLPMPMPLFDETAPEDAKECPAFKSRLEALIGLYEFIQDNSEGIKA